MFKLGIVTERINNVVFEVVVLDDDIKEWDGSTASFVDSANLSGVSEKETVKAMQLVQRTTGPCDETANTTQRVFTDTQICVMDLVLICEVPYFIWGMFDEDFMGEDSVSHIIVGIILPSRVRGIAEELVKT